MNEIPDNSTISAKKYMLTFFFIYPSIHPSVQYISLHMVLVLTGN